MANEISKVRMIWCLRDEAPDMATLDVRDGQIVREGPEWQRVEQAEVGPALEVQLMDDPEVPRRFCLTESQTITYQVPGSGALVVSVDGVQRFLYAAHAWRAAMMVGKPNDVVEISE